MKRHGAVSQPMKRHGTLHVPQPMQRPSRRSGAASARKRAPWQWTCVALSRTQTVRPTRAKPRHANSKEGRHVPHTEHAKPKEAMRVSTHTARARTHVE